MSQNSLHNFCLVNRVSTMARAARPMGKSLFARHPVNFAQQLFSAIDVSMLYCPADVMAVDDVGYMARSRAQAKQRARGSH